MKYKPLFLLITSTLLLSACDTHVSSSVLSTSTDGGSQESIVDPCDDYESMSQSDISKSISIEWGLYDPEFYWFCTGESYPVTYRFDDVTNEGSTVTISNPNVASVEMTSTGFTLNALTAGNALITIKDSTGYTHYRTTIRVRTTVPQSQMPTFLVSVDHYQSWQIYSNDLQLIFLDSENAILQGKDEGVGIGSVSFQYEFLQKEDKEYVYQVKNFNNQASTLNLLTLRISLNGFLINAMSGTSVTEATTLPYTAVIKERTTQA